MFCQLHTYIPWSGEQSIDKRVLLVFPMKDKYVLCLGEQRKKKEEQGEDEEEEKRKGREETNKWSLNCDWVTRDILISVVKVSVNSLCLCVCMCVCTCVHINQHDCATNSVGRCGSMADWLAVINLQPQWVSGAASLPQENITCCHTNTPQSSLQIYHKQRKIHTLTHMSLSHVEQRNQMYGFVLISSTSPWNPNVSNFLKNNHATYFSYIYNLINHAEQLSGRVIVKLEQKYIPWGLIQGIMQSLRPVASIYSHFS